MAEDSAIQCSSICNDDSHNENLCVPPKSSPEPDFRGLGAALLDVMRKNGDKIVQYDSETGNTETHAEFLSRCIRVANEMRAQNISSEDVVGLCTLNNMDCFVPFIATIFNASRVAPFDPTLSLQDTVHLLKMVQPRIIFCDEEGSKLIENALEQADLKTDIVVFGETDRFIPFSKFLVSCGDEDNFEAKQVKDLSDEVIILFSSGTTGFPKGISIPHHAVLYQLIYYTMTTVNYAVTRLYWFSGILSNLIALYNGGSWVVDSKFDMKDIFRILHEFKVSFVIVPPLFAIKINQNSEHCKYDVSCVKAIVVLGGIIGEQQILDLRKLFPTTFITVPYGMSETVGGVTGFNPYTHLKFVKAKPTSIGRVLPGSCLKVVNIKTGQTLGPNENGEIRLKSNHNMRGYYNDPETTRNTFDKDGYFCTGDVGYYDEDYCFFIVDRIKDVMKYQAWKVAPAELEAVLLTHPEILEAAVVAIPHKEDGDHPMGIVVLKEGSKATPEDIIKYVEERVINSKRLRGGVKIIDSIPKTPTFKLRRRDLRDMVLKGKL